MKKIVFVLLFVLLFGLCAPAGMAEESEEAVGELVEAYMEENGLNEENFAMGWLELESGRSWYYGADTFMVAGSMYKVPLNLAIYDMLAEGELKPDAYAGNYTVKNALYQSIVRSRNEAAQALRYLISKDLHEYRNVLAKYSGYEIDELPETYYSENCISPRYLINTLKYLYDNSEKYPELIENMKQASKGNYFQKGNTEFPIAHKYGSFETSVNDCAIVYAERPFALVVFTRGLSNGETILSQLCARMIEYSKREVTEPDPTPTPAQEPTPEPTMEPVPEPTQEPVPTPDPATPTPAAGPAERGFDGGPFLYIMAALIVAIGLVLALLGRKGRVVSLLLLSGVLAGVLYFRSGSPVPTGTEAALPDVSQPETGSPSPGLPTALPSQEPGPEPEQPTPEPTYEPSPEHPRDYVLTFAGDCTIGTLHEWYDSKDNKNMLTVIGEDYEYPFSGVVDIFEDDDFTMVNLEGTFTNETKAKRKDYRFRGAPEYAQVLPAGSVEAVTLANNHSGDYLEAGLEETRAALEENGVLWAEESAPLIVTLDGGMKLGVAAFNCVEIDLDVGDVTNYMKRVRPMYDACVEADCDLILMYAHWGWEYRDKPETWMVRFAHEMVDIGFDMVIGSHAHILQPYEEYNGVPIYYGLGNFCYGGNRAPDDVDTVILRQSVTWDGETASLGQVELIPCSITSADGYNDFHPVPYEEGSDDWQRVMRKLGLS